MTIQKITNAQVDTVIHREYFSNLEHILHATGGGLSNLAPARIGIIRDSLFKSEDVRERLAIALDTLANAIEEHDDVDSLLAFINEDLVILIACLKASEESFYEKGSEVERARQELYALHLGFKHSQGAMLYVFSVEKENFLRGSGAYWVRLSHLLRIKHEDFLEQDRKRPTYIATTWAMESSSEVQAMSRLGQEVIMISVHTLPHFEADEDNKTDDLQLAYLDENPVHGTNVNNAFAVVLNSCGNAGVYRSNDKQEKQPLPVSLHLAFAASMAAGEVGTNLSGNEGIGLLIEGAKNAQVYQYRRSSSALRKELINRGVLTLTGRHIRGHATTCVGGDKPSYEDYSAMDAYVAICRAIEQYMINKIDSVWSDDSEEKLRDQLKAFFDDLYAPRQGKGRRVLKKQVNVDEEVAIKRDEITGEVQIFAEIHLPGVINGASITVDPVVSDEHDANE